jgi:hypothetical protein
MFYGDHESFSSKNLGVMAYMFDDSCMEIIISLLSICSAKDIGVRKSWAKEFLDTRPSHQLFCNESLNQVATLVRTKINA